QLYAPHRDLPSFPTRRSSDLATSPVRWKAAERYAASSTARIVPAPVAAKTAATKAGVHAHIPNSSQEWNVYPRIKRMAGRFFSRSEEHTSELQSRRDLVCRLL